MAQISHRDLPGLGYNIREEQLELWDALVAGQTVGAILPLPVPEVLAEHGSEAHNENGRPIWRWEAHTLRVDPNEGLTSHAFRNWHAVVAPSFTWENDENLLSLGYLTQMEIFPWSTVPLLPYQYEDVKNTLDVHLDRVYYDTIMGISGDLVMEVEDLLDESWARERMTEFANHLQSFGIPADRKSSEEMRSIDPEKVVQGLWRWAENIIHHFYDLACGKQGATEQEWYEVMTHPTGLTSSIDEWFDFVRSALHTNAVEEDAMSSYLTVKARAKA